MNFLSNTLSKLLIIFMLCSCTNIHVVQGDDKPRLVIDSPWEECKLKTKRKAVILKCKYKF